MRIPRKNYLIFDFDVFAVCLIWMLKKLKIVRMDRRIFHEKERR